MTIRGMTTVLAALAAIHSARAAVDCSSQVVEWAATYVAGSYQYDEAAQTTKFCYSFGYESNYDEASAECAPPGGQAQALTKVGLRFLSCFADENGGLREEMGTWDVAASDSGYAEETMEGENNFNGNLWTSALPATGQTATYCATFKRKLNLSAVPNTAMLSTDGSRFAIAEVQGPECYLAPTTSSTVPPPTTTVPPSTSTTVPPPTTTVPPSESTSTTVPPPTTTVPPSESTSTTVPPPTTTVPPSESTSTTVPPPTTTVPPSESTSTTVPPPTTTTVPPSTSTTVPPTTTTVPPETSVNYVGYPETIDTVDVVVSPSASPAAPSASSAAAEASSGTSAAVTAGAVAGASVGAGLLAAAAAAFVYARRRSQTIGDESQVDMQPYAA